MPQSPNLLPTDDPIDSPPSSLLTTNKNRGCRASFGKLSHVQSRYEIPRTDFVHASLMKQSVVLSLVRWPMHIMFHPNRRSVSSPNSRNCWS